VAEIGTKSRIRKDDPRDPANRAFHDDEIPIPFATGREDGFLHGS
jgi:hypothetical protein